MSITDTFGSKLRSYREEKNISLRELAKRVGVSGAFMSDIELGRRFPSPDKMEQIAAQIDVSIEELKKLDFRDEAEAIRKMMFADSSAGMAFRTVAEQFQKGKSAQEIISKLTEAEG